MCKSAPEETWANAPVIDAGKKIPHPYGTIFRYTSSKLEEVSLRYMQEFPTVLRHLADHCPRVTRLQLHPDLIVNFKMLVPLFSRIVGRITHLTISSLPFDSSQKEPANLGSLLKAIRAIFDSVEGPLKITHLIFYRDIFGKIAVDQATLQYLLQSLPALKHCEVPAPFNPNHVKTIFGASEQLNYLEIYHQGNIMPFTRFCDYLSALSATNVGFNLSLSSDSMVPDDMLNNEQRPKGAQFFDALMQTGARGSIGPQTVIDMLLHLCQENCIEEAEEMVRLIMAKTCPILPPASSLAPYHRQANSLWQEIIETGTFSLLKLCLEAFSFPEISKFRLRAWALQKPEFDAAYMDAISQAPGPATLQLDMAHEVNSLFAFVGSPEALQWLLSQMSEEEAFLQLHTSPKGITEAAPIFNALRFESVLVSHFKQSNILSFANDEPGFVYAVRHCAQHQKTDLFKRIATATGPTMSPLASADVLLLLVDSKDMLSFWISFLNENSIVPDFTVASQGPKGRWLLPSRMPVQGSHE
jgi:hypothetical protein